MTAHPNRARKRATDIAEYYEYRLVLGVVSDILSDGRIVVCLAGPPKTEVSVAWLDRFGSEPQRPKKGDNVAVDLYFPGSEMPVIVGVIRDRCTPVSLAVPSKLASNAAQFDELSRILVSANDEVTIQCGAASITLKKNGRIVLKGRSIVSRSSGPNKIRGTSINLN